MIILVTNFQKSPSAGGSPSILVTRSCVCDLAKLWIFKLIMTKSNFKNQLCRIFSGVINITSQKNVTKIMLQNFSILGLSNQNFWLVISQCPRIICMKK